MTYPRRDSEERQPRVVGAAPGSAGASPERSGAQAGTHEEDRRYVAPGQPVEIRIVQERPTDTGTRPAARDRHAGARWFWRIAAVVGLLAVVFFGLEMLASLHQHTVGQAAPTTAINRQTGVLQGIDQQLAADRTAIRSLVAAVGPAVAALRRMAGG